MQRRRLRRNLSATVAGWPGLRHRETPARRLAWVSLRSNPSHLLVISRHGLSRVEWLIAALMCGLLLFGIQRGLLIARETSRRQTCADHLRQVHLGLMSYHDAFGRLPPAAVWRARPGDELAKLPWSDDPSAVTFENWLTQLLPFADGDEPVAGAAPGEPIGAPANRRLRTAVVPWVNCPSDERNGERYTLSSRAYGAIEFARGNYAINGGTSRMARFPGTTADPAPGGYHLEIDEQSRAVRFWGNGVAGFNRSFSLDDMANGLSTLVAVDEVRSGIHPRDPRGVWALGQIGSSVTWAHGMNGDAGRPNAEAPLADDIAGCVELHAIIGGQRLVDEGMPCCSYCLYSEQATARSRHPGGVHALTLDGAVHFMANVIDAGLWHVLHSRETPPAMFDVAGSVADAFDIPAAKPQGTLEATATSLANSIGMQLVRLPPGRFIMGLPDEELNAVFETDGAAAAHWVEITRPIWMGACEVTSAEYAAVMEPAGAVAPSSPRLPMGDVSWNEAEEFCRRLSARLEEASAGRRYRLPTEAEWEYACRSGSTRPHVYVPERQPGDETGENAMKTPSLPIAEAGSYPPNAFGLFDLRGNVWEWCVDWSHPDYYGQSPEQDPTGSPTGYLKVVRGSDWLYGGQRCLLGFRATEPWLRSPFIGFRVVCEFE